jgi:nucleotide-binding universal stress UspA family protein
MRYLVAIDGSETSTEAVGYATTHAEKLDATLELVHVVVPEAEFVDGELVQPGNEELLERGEAMLEQAETTATEHGDVAVETTLLSGRPAAALADHAESVGADAIYLGHRGLSEKREEVAGSVAKRLLGTASVPVTVV